jgi:hypothetical protein
MVTMIRFPIGEYGHVITGEIIFTTDKYFSVLPYGTTDIKKTIKILRQKHIDYNIWEK